MHDMRRTKAQLIEELQRLRHREAHTDALAREHERVERAMRERVKELNCLYGISHLAQNRDLPLDEMIRQVGELVCASWQYPEITCARIRIESQDSTTRNYRPSAWSQSSPISIQEERLGEIEVLYLEKRPESDEGPFLREERNLIDAVAHKLGRLVQASRTEAHMRVLSRELIKAQENERLRIATELHDHLAQDLAALKLDLGELMEQPPPPGPPMQQRLAELTEGLSKAITSIRDLAYDLLPPGLEDLGLVRTLARYCADFANRSGLVVDFFADGMEGVRLGFETQINIYRLVQESLTNVRKHAQAGQATVRIIRSYPSIIVRIEDDGQGVDLEPRQDEFYQAKKMGIWGMRERARLLGGRITLRSRPGQGMRIHIEIPLENMNNGA
ncbi:MAG: sensor histidine kinase [Deltaproteobacteria bacterium HGW-Deltaproteobacteria-8]|jgi:signal transduction histidine kinase|nr:MAG: sensor histidine kinase [Deltaproteobacteria bacterium HGW-Deltaproteobacteria-8]